MINLWWYIMHTRNHRPDFINLKSKHDLFALQRIKYRERKKTFYSSKQSTCSAQSKQRA